MRIAQIILPNASEYERKSQRVDRTALADRHEVVVATPETAAASGSDVVHVYATGELPSLPFRRFALPYIASADVSRTRWPFGRPVEPDYVVSPILDKVEQSRYQPLPEAVEDVYFHAPPAERDSGDRKMLGTFSRPSVRPMVEQILARVQRFRSDVDWVLFDHVPTVDDLTGVDAWVDPAVDETDFDGFVAEALVVGLTVVAARTAMNLKRLEHGRTGFLVPPRDPNEMTHAILAALFKRETVEGKQLAARQTASKFRASQRVRVLTHMYETLIP